MPLAPKNLNLMGGQKFLLKLPSLLRIFPFTATSECLIMPLGLLTQNWVNHSKTLSVHHLMECERVKSLHKPLEVALRHCPAHCKHADKTRMQDWLTSFAAKKGGFPLFLLFEAVEAAFWEVALLIFGSMEAWIWRWSTKLETCNCLSKLSRRRADPQKNSLTFESKVFKGRKVSILWVWRDLRTNPWISRQPRIIKSYIESQNPPKTHKKISQPDSKAADVPRNFRNSSILLRVASLSACVATITQHLSFRMALLKSLSAVHATPVSFLGYQSLAFPGIFRKPRYWHINVTF